MKKEKTFIIAEAGVNHNGSIKVAKALIDAAKWAGADAVKFQIFNTDSFVTKSAPKAKYQKGTTSENSQYEMLKKLELSQDDFLKIAAYCEKRKIVFLATPFDIGSVDFLVKIGVPTIKISSGELNNIPFLEYIARFGKPIILSTGMAIMGEIEDAINAIHKARNKKITLLQCTSNYPVAFRDVNIKAMQTLKDKFHVPVGFSDHTVGMEASIAAVALGASVIEKHFTLRRKMKGPDHKASLEPAELKKMIASIRNVELALGDGLKKLQNSEMNIKKVARKSLVAISDVGKGEKIEKEMIGIKRPENGIPPKYYSKIIGKYAAKKIRKNSLLKWGDII